MDTAISLLRVAHIVTQLELGGAQSNTLYTVGHLDRKRYEPLLICGPGGILDYETREAPWRTLFVTALVRPVRPWRDAAALIALYKVLRTEKPHIVHTHSSKAGILGRMAAYLAGVPVIVHTFHGFGFNNRQKPWTRNLFIALERFCARLCRHLVFVSEENRAEAATLHIGDGIPRSLIRSGIQLNADAHPSSRSNGDQADPKPDPRTLRERFDIPRDAWVVVYVGNFKPQKNPLDLIHVAQKVLAQSANRTLFHFVLVGDGELQEKARALAEKLGISARVHFMGWQKRRDDVQKILKEANSFLLTSLWEGLPRSLVESFAASKPAVAYGVDGVRDILRDEETGFLIPVGDTARAAEKTVWLAENPTKAREMGQKGHDRVVKEFDIDLMVRQQETLYAALYDAVPLKNYYEPLWTAGTRSTG